ncbi:protein of unknown function DUF983 [Methylobacterium sp. 4-46]|uniref:DUF983 domain-containing protein n=1 Tax=unclassified Methylobacterium TaxID=2615210 RepID=UPI000165CC70|nr:MULTISPECIES: DUF983 domain-containing protein [Methylobacterium]ACA20924.1 protein of unknown function DUF983 [Methylobacterium sp. 4-46]WFT80079.1 DUF983 domain-containing protein [Methylobacterium nodulans]
MIEIDGRDAPAQPPAEVPWHLAMLRGFRNRCPHCGEGRLFGRFLKVREACEACGTELHHHRADDLPPYLVIFIVGHVVGLAILESQMRLDELPLWFELTFWPAVTLIMALALLQPVKGAVVGLQYALGMHGFSAIRRARTGTGQGGEARDGARDGGDDRERGRAPGLRGA